MDAETLYTVRQRFFTGAQQAVQSYAGTMQPVVDTDFLAAFGAPMAQEDHAQRAVLAAISLQRSLRHLGTDLAPGTGEERAVCLGVHTGEVMVGARGDAASARRGGRRHHAAGRAAAAAGRPGAISAQRRDPQLVQGCSAWRG